MTIQDLGSIGELVGAVATVATLLYLAVQIRQNTRTVRASGTATHASTTNDLNLVLAQDDELRRVYFRGLEDYEELSEDEQQKFDRAIGTYVSNLQSSYYLKEDGALSENAWAQVEVSIAWLLDQPGFSAYWKVWRTAHSPGFCQFVESCSRRNAKEQQG